ncbi:MAG: hypothetical protein JNL82_06795 [Myxococcales bacterium]|nr:hypothetical protein [Myxococcales bacterium]
MADPRQALLAVALLAACAGRAVREPASAVEASRPPLRVEAVRADRRAGGVRLQVRAPAGHGYEPGRLVGLYADADAFAGSVPVGAADVVEASEHGFELLAQWLDPVHRGRPLVVGPIPPGHHFGFRLGQIVADDGDPRRVRINMGDAHGVAPGAMYTVLGEPYADVDAGGRSLGRASVGVVQVVEASRGGLTALAELRHGVAPVGAYVRHAGHEPVAPRPSLRILVTRFAGDRGDLYSEALLHALELALREAPAAEISVARGDRAVATVDADDADALRQGRTHRADLVVWGSASALGDDIVVRPRLTLLDARAAGPRPWAPLVLAAARLTRAEPDALSRRLHGLAAYLVGRLYFTDFEAKVEGSYARAAAYFRVAIAHADAEQAEQAELALFECLDRVGDWAGADRLARAIEASGRTRGDPARRAVGLLLRARIAEHTGELDAALADARAAADAFTALAMPRDAALALRLVADVMVERGQGEASLRLLREELLPVFDRLGDVRERAVTLAGIAEILHARGEYDEALRLLRDEVLPALTAAGAARPRARALRAVADVLSVRGELDEALRLRRDEVLPVFVRLGDRREQADTLGRIADVLQARGELDAALRLRRDEVLPIQSELGDLAGQALTLSRMADALQSRGELDAALRLRRDEVLPRYEKLGDPRGRARTLGQLALIARHRGELDEALRVLTREVLPIHEALGDALQRAHTLAEIAYTRHLRGDVDGALRLYRERVVPAFRRLGAAQFEAGAKSRMASILRERGELDEALRLYLEEALPVFERLGLRRHRVQALLGVAAIRRARGELDEALRVLLAAGEGPSVDPVRAEALEQLVALRRARGEAGEALRLLRDELLPLRRRLGNKWQQARTLDEIAELVAARGELDEAIRIRGDEVLPMLEAMHAPETLARCRWQAAVVRLARGAPGDREAAADLLSKAQAAAEAHALPFARDIAALRAGHRL